MSPPALSTIKLSLRELASPIGGRCMNNGSDWIVWRKSGSGLFPKPFSPRSPYFRIHRKLRQSGRQLPPDLPALPTWILAGQTGRGPSEFLGLRQNSNSRPHSAPPVAT
jgi:hypothetical protein